MNTHIPPRACKCASNVFNPKKTTSALAYFLLQFIKIKFQNFIYFLSTCTTILLYRYYAAVVNFEISSNLLRLGLQEDSVYMCVYTDFHSTLVIIEIIMKNHQKTLSDAGKLWLEWMPNYISRKEGLCVSGFWKQAQKKPTCYCPVSRNKCIQNWTINVSVN